MTVVSSFGRFEIVEELGRGGMGVVFRANDPEMGRAVALKVLRLDPSLDASQKEEVRRRFEREAKSAGGLNHPNIVAHYERGQVGEHQFIVMELVEGRALHKLMSGDTRLDLATMLSIVRQMAAALDYAHGRGVVHRDIKPANVLLPSSGGVKIADFGIAKSTTAGTLTASSMVLGSPHYMSPEQIEGRTVTGRSDQWALAVTAYELLAGRKPFDSDSIAALFQQILATQPRDPSEIDPRIPSAARLVFQRALSKRPEERYDTCGAFVEALASAATGEMTPPAAVQKELPRRRIGNWVWTALSALAVVAVCTGLAWILLHRTAAPQPKASQVSTPVTPVSDPSLKPGQTRVNRRDNLTYIWVAPGSFVMGCSPGDNDCHQDETTHNVTLTRGYWLGQTEVTVDAFRHFTLATEAVMPKAPDENPNWTDESMPISNVAWSVAASYCNWIAGRLPTEAEWEFAARAGSSQLRYGPPEYIAWFKENSNARAHTVRTRHPNDLGLFDMLGNVWEWTADRYSRDYYSQSPKNDPRGPENGEYRVLRGGSWLRTASDLRVSLRYPALPDSPDQLVGFRCAANELP
jgi:serine/threonine protein kinase